MSAVISTPHLAVILLDEGLAAATRRWEDWVHRDATLITRKNQAQDTPGVAFEFLWSTFRLRPALIPEVVIAELRLVQPEHNPEAVPLQFQPCLPWAWPQWIAVEVRDEDPDSLWVIPRTLTNEDFPASR